MHSLLPFTENRYPYPREGYQQAKGRRRFSPMGRSNLFAREHDESESTAEADPLRLHDSDDDDDDDAPENEDETQIMVGAGVASGALGL